MHKALPFPLSMHNEIIRAIRIYDRRVFVKFKKQLSNSPKLDPRSKIVSTHNSFIIGEIIDTQSIKSKLNATIFLLPSDKLQIKLLYELISNIPDSFKKTRNIVRALKHLSVILSNTPELINKFAMLLQERTCKWGHFYIISDFGTHVSPEITTNIINIFIKSASRFDATVLKHLEGFISSITPKVFFEYIRPFLDSNMLRNCEKFVHLLPYYILPLQFSIYSLPKRTCASFLDTLSNSCLSHDNSLSNKCIDALSKISHKINPKCFKINPKSIIGLFSTAPPSKPAISIAIQQLENKKLLHAARSAIKLYMVKIAQSKLYDINKFISEILIPEGDFNLIFMLIDNGISNSLVIDSIKENKTPIANIIRSKISNAPLTESDINSFISSFSFYELTDNDAHLITEICKFIKPVFPVISAKTFTRLAAANVSSQKVIENIRKCIKEGNCDFINGILMSYKSRPPSELKALLGNISCIYDKLSNTEAAILITAGYYDIPNDSKEIAEYILKISDSEWIKPAQKALVRLASRPISHHTIVRNILNNPLKLNSAPLLAALFRHFSYDTYFDLFQKVFKAEDRDNSLVIETLSNMPQYRDCAFTLAKVLSNPGSSNIFHREFLFSFLPKRSWSDFDFILLHPFMPYLMSVNDQIAHRTANIVGQFSHIPLCRSVLLEGVELTGNEEALAKLMLADEMKEFTESDTAIALSKTKSIAAIASRVVVDHPVFKHSSVICALTIRDIYMDWLPSFAQYLESMIGLNIDHGIDVALDVKRAMECAPMYRKDISTNIKILIENGRGYTKIAVRILSLLVNYHGCDREVLDLLFSLKPNEYNPEDYNRAIIGRLSKKFPDDVISYFFSKPDFKHVRSEVLPCLDDAYKYTISSTEKLTGMIEAAAIQTNIDHTIAVLLRCLDACYQRDKEGVKKKADQTIYFYEKYPLQVTCLYFHFVPDNDKMGYLKGFLTSRTEKYAKMGTELMRYLFLNPAENHAAEQLIKSLVDYIDINDDSTVEFVHGALQSAASTLGEDAMEIALPSIIEIITPDLSKKSQKALVSVLITIGKRFPDLLLKHLDKLLSGLLYSPTRVYSIDEFILLVEDALLKSDYPSLLRCIVSSLRMNIKPLDLIKLISDNSEQFSEGEKLCITVLDLIKHFFNSSDPQTKLLSYSVLAKLNIPDSKLNQLIDVFLSVMSDLNWKQIAPHVIEFVNRSDYQRKLKIKDAFWKVRSTLNWNQSAGFALIYAGILIEIGSDNLVMELINDIYRTEEITSEIELLCVEQIIDLNPSKFDHLTTRISKTFIESPRNHIASITRILQKYAETVSQKIIPEFLRCLIDGMSHSIPNVREMVCQTVVYLMKKRQGWKSWIDIATPSVYSDLTASAAVLRLVGHQTGPAEKLWGILDPSYKAKVFTGEFDFQYQLGRFLNGQTSRGALHYICDIAEKKKDNLTWLLQTWNKNPSFNIAFQVCISIISDVGLINLVEAINKINEVTIQTPIPSVENDDPPIFQMMAVDVYKTALELLYAKNGINILCLFYKAYHLVAWKNELLIFNIIAKTLRPDAKVDTPVQRTQSPQVIASRNVGGRSAPTGVVPRLMSTPVQQNQPLPNRPTETREKVQILDICSRQELEVAYVDIGSMYGGREIGDFIARNMIPHIDILNMTLLQNIAILNPKFFVAQTTTALLYQCFLKPLFSADKTYRQMCENSINEIFHRLSVDDATQFLENMTSFFVSCKQSSCTLLSDNFIGSIAKYFIMHPTEILYDTALFFTAVFNMISPEILHTIAQPVATLMLAKLVQDYQIEPFYDIFTAICLFLPHVEANADVLAMATLSCCLNYAMFDNTQNFVIRCDLLSITDTALSLGVPARLVIEPLSRKLRSFCPCAPAVLESIEWVLSRSDQSLDNHFLDQLWNSVRTFFRLPEPPQKPKKDKEKEKEKEATSKSDDDTKANSDEGDTGSEKPSVEKRSDPNKQNVQEKDISTEMMSITIARIGAYIINMLVLDANGIYTRNSIMSTFFPYVFKRPCIEILSAFSAVLKNPELVAGLVEVARLNLLDCKPVLPLLAMLPVFSALGKASMLEILSFLVRGLVSEGYVAPKMCYAALKEMAADIRAIEIDQASVIVTGIYFASIDCSPMLRGSAVETLRAILGGSSEEVANFRMKYIQCIDPTVANAILKDIN